MIRQFTASQLRNRQTANSIKVNNTDTSVLLVSTVIFLSATGIEYIRFRSTQRKSQSARKRKELLQVQASSTQKR